MLKNETITAIATGLTDSGIGIIRISGDKAIEIGNCIFRSPSGKRILEQAQSHLLNYGYAVQMDKKEERVIDEVLAVVMKAPRSFTGDDVVEIQCHGGVLVMKRILTAVLQAGARLAEPGEFTKRAFLNGKIDLAEAEAVMDLIHSQNEYALESSINQLRGALSNEIIKLRKEIIYEIAYIESALDDPEHISLDGYYEKLGKKIDKLLKSVQNLLSSAENGRIIKEGINTVIIGKPNAGKSSLMNILVGEETAIVTNIEGTTRDILKESVSMNGLHLTITDTAGIRDTEDQVEKIGVEKAQKCAMDADLVLYVIDSSTELDERDRKIISILEHKKIIILLNKSDLDSKIDEKTLKLLLEELERKENKVTFVKTSIKNNEGIEQLQNIVKEMFYQGNLKLNHEIIITNMRHKEALQDTYESLLMVKKSIEDEMPEDFLSIDFMSAYSSLGRISGEEVKDDLVDEIFSKFCMGK